MKFHTWKKEKEEHSSACLIPKYSLNKISFFHWIKFKCQQHKKTVFLVYLDASYWRNIIKLRISSKIFSHNSEKNKINGDENRIWMYRLNNMPGWQPLNRKALHEKIIQIYFLMRFEIYLQWVWIMNHIEYWYELSSARYENVY